MEKLSWTENLEKGAHPLPAIPTYQPKPPNLHSDLFCMTDADGSPVRVEKSSAAVDIGDTPSAAEIIAKTVQCQKLGLRALEKRADTDDDLYARRAPALLDKDIAKVIGVSERDMSGEDPLQKAVANFGPPRWPNLSSAGYGTPPVRPDLDLIDAAWEELIGSSAYPETKQEPKKAANSETLAKSEISSRMFGVLAQLRSSCQGNEAELIEKSIRALDTAAFAQLTETVLARMKKVAA